MARRKIDWVRHVESPVSDVLRRYARGQLVAIDAMRLIDEIMARATLRGHVLPSRDLDWEPQGMPETLACGRRTDDVAKELGAARW